MKYAVLILLVLLGLSSQIQAANWPLDDVADTMIVRGTAKAASGVSGQSLVLDGTSLIELKDSAKLASDAFTLSLWFNPYDLTGGQQMLAGKNRYSLNERQWSLTIEPDGKLKAHLRQVGWSTISCDEPLVAGQWHFATMVVDAGKATLYLNGKPPSNLPMATSKPYAGILRNGQRYLVCTTTADTGGRRSPLTIAVSEPGKDAFSKVFLIRTSVFQGTPGVSDAKADFSYPYAVEHEGKLYVGYTHKSHAANELAVIPVSSLEIKP